MRRWSEVGQRIVATTRTWEASSLPTTSRPWIGALAPAASSSRVELFAEADAARWASVGRRRGTVTRRRRLRRSSARRSTATPTWTGGQRRAGGAGRRRRPCGAAAVQPFDPLPARPEPLSVPDVATAFGAIEAARGPAAKAAVFEASSPLRPLTATYVVRSWAGSCGSAFAKGWSRPRSARVRPRPPAAVARAVCTGDLGETALLALDDRLADAAFAFSIRSASCLRRRPRTRPRSSRRLGRGLDRGQVRRDPGPAPPPRDEVRLSARPPRRDGPFPEVAAAARGCPGRFLDGELLALRDGGVLPFLALQSGSGGRRRRPSSSRTCPSPRRLRPARRRYPRRRRRAPLDLPLRERRADSRPRPARADVAGPGRPWPTRLCRPLRDPDSALFALSRLVSARSADDLERISPRLGTGATRA